MYKNFKFLNYSIYVLLLFYLMVDTLTGISLKTVGVSFSIPYKAFIISLMVIVIGMYNQTDFLIILSLFTWLILSITVMILFGSHNFALAIQTYIKTVSAIIFYLYFKSFIKFEQHSYKYLRKILVVNAFVFSANIFAGILGFGYSTYDYGVGIKGFFYAGNEIFLILLAITALLLKNRNKKFRMCVGLISLLFSILIGTKTAMLALMIIVLVNAFTNLRKISKIFVIFSLPLFILLFIILFNSVLSSLPVFNNMIYNFEKNKKLTGSILSALLSGRVEFLNNNLDFLKERADFWHFIFGGNAYFNNKSVEIDFFDTLILNGVFVAVVIFCFYIFLFYRAVRKHDVTLMAMNFSLIMISFTAGHVWANLTGGIFFIIANIVPNIFETIKHKRRKHYVIKL